MIDFKLANILLAADERTELFPVLYYHSSSIIVSDVERGGTTLMPFQKYDFGTYFNSFSNAKWQEYADVDNVRFHIEAKGKAEFVFYRVNKLIAGLERKIVGRIKVDSDCFSDIDFVFPETKGGILAFWVATNDYLTVRNGYYSTMVDEDRIRDIHLAIATTTYKHEEYISNNISLFKKDIRQCGDPVAECASMIVVDNGQSLEREALEGDGVYVFPNKNVGGAGGFARGMIEAGRLDHKVTHVLIMDDDIQLSSESIKRTFSLLSLVNNKYAEAFISGAMFSLVNQANQHEDIGRINNLGRHGAIKRPACMDNLENVFENERIIPDQDNTYAAFWYCCIPMKTIEKHGLPLPIFIRFDDAEYGLRCKPKFMTMNGINVWHMDFGGRYNPVYERYYLLRNLLIIQATSGVCSNIDFIEQIFKPRFTLELQRFNYSAAEFLLEAVDDFLKGPEFVMENNDQELLASKLSRAEKFTPIEELGIGNTRLTELDSKDKRSKRSKRIDAVTYNGQRFTPENKRRKGMVAIRFAPDSHPGRKIHFRKQLLVVDRLGEQGAIRQADPERFSAIIKHYKQTIKRYEQMHVAIEQLFAQAQGTLVSDTFWKNYLGIS